MSGRIQIYTDGSSIGNPGPGGYGIIMEWKGKDYVKEFSKGFRLTTNNRMELFDIYLKELDCLGHKYHIITGKNKLEKSIEKISPILLNK